MPRSNTLPTDTGQTDPAAFPGKGRGALLAGLGASAWSSSLGWPLLTLGRTTRPWSFSLAALLPLLAGLAVDRSARTATGQSTARWLLLAAYPAALAFALSSFAPGQAERAHTALSIALAALTLAAYAAVAALATREPAQTLPAVREPLPKTPAPQPQPGHTLRIISSVVMIAGAFCLAVVAPMFPEVASVEAAWGDTAAAGSVLAALLAGGLAVSVVALFLGSVLRADAAELSPTGAELRARVLLMLFVALLAGVVYYTITP